MDSCTQPELDMGGGSHLWVPLYPENCSVRTLIFAFSVNLGGWFVLEPFISPSLFQMYPGAVDEWSLSILMAADTANGGLNQIETHYQTFIVSRLHKRYRLSSNARIDRTGLRADCRRWAELD